MEEIWKSVSEVADILELELEEGKDYQISNLGNFRVEDSEGNIEEGHITYSDSQATITVGKRQVLLHRLVALLFVPNDDPETNTVVIYLDGNHRNNCADNLTWLSVSERNERRYHNQSSTTIVRCKDEDKLFVSATSASLYYGIAVDIIKYSIMNRTPCFGHVFDYADEVSNGTALYLSTRKAKSLSTMLKDREELKQHFNSIQLK